MGALENLVLQAKQGDLVAFDGLVKSFQDMAYGAAYTRLRDATLAQDAAQEAFLEAYLKLGTLKFPLAFPTWLKRIVFKQCDRLQRRTRIGSVSLEFMQAGAVNADEADVLQTGDLHERLNLALDQLPPPQRLALSLFYVSQKSHAEVARFLNVPVSTVKKRLHDGRKRMRERMSDVVEALNEAKPSGDETFSQAIQFFLAVRGGDVKRVRTLLDRTPDLIHAREKWDSERAVRKTLPFPTGQTPLIRAAQNGDVAMVRLLLSRGATIQGACGCRTGEQPLHASALSLSTDVIRLLLRLGADINATDAAKYTALHLLVMREAADLVLEFLREGADPNLQDCQGFTPLHWAAMKGSLGTARILLDHRANPAIQSKAGETACDLALKRNHHAVAALLNGKRIAKAPPSAARGPAWTRGLLQTGIKCVDLLAPCPIGGRMELHGWFGVGRFVVLAEIIHNFAARYSGRVIWAGWEEQPFELDEIAGEIKELGLGDTVSLIYSRAAEPLRQRRTLADRAADLCGELRSSGEDVLLVVDVHPEFESDVRKLERSAGIRKTGSTTVLFVQRPSQDQPPEDLPKFRDARIVLDNAMKPAALYPAIGPRSDSRVWNDRTIPAKVRRCALECRTLMLRLRELCPTLNRAEVEAIGGKERKNAEIALKLQLYLTQPFNITEHFLGMPAETLPLAQTLADCQAILEGRLDDVPDKAIAYTGTLEQILAKATSSL